MTDRDKLGRYVCEECGMSCIDEIGHLDTCSEYDTAAEAAVSAEVEEIMEMGRNNPLPPDEQRSLMWAIVDRMFASSSKDDRRKLVNMLTRPRDVD